MHRFYIPPDRAHGSEIRLEATEAHHALHVLRLKAGQQVTVLDGVGHALICEIQSTGRKSVGLVVRQKKFTPGPGCEITLLQAIPKAKLMENIIQKATELGARRIVPLLSERTITHLDPVGALEKQEKWHMVAVEAIKQCGQTWLPEVGKPSSPETFLAESNSFDLGLVASLQDDARPAREVLRGFLEGSTRPRSIAVAIGPEGDFSTMEVERFKQAKFLPVTLGKLVLRCETAAVFCLSILNYELP